MKKILIIIIVSLIFLVVIGLAWFVRPVNTEITVDSDQQKPQDEIVILKDSSIEASTIITLPIVPRGDIAYQPIEDDCQGKLEGYVESLEFSKSEFSKCELIESREGMGDDDCPNGFSINGCSICKLKCE